MQWIRRNRTQILIFLILLSCYSYFLPRWADWNQNSRLDLVLAIVDQGTLSIDDYYENTGDYALFEGHYYSDKAPGNAFLAVPVYAALRPVLRSAPVERVMARLASSDAFAGTLNEQGTGLLEEKITFAVVLYVVTFFTVAIPAALLGVVLFNFLGALTDKVGWRLFIVLAYGLGTSAFPYSGSFFGHQVVASFLMAALYLSWRIGQGELAPAWLVAVGLLLGASIITEYPTVLIAAAIFIYASLTVPDRRWIAGMVGGGLPWGLLLVAYNMAIYHRPIAIGYTYSELYTDLHQTGFISISFPRLSAMWGITFGSYRGLFFLSPILLLAVPGFVAWWRQRAARGIWWVSAWAVVSFFLFNGSSIMWHGGYAIGPRYLLPMLPFMTLGLGAFAQARGDRTWARVLAGVLGAWSFLAIWAETIGGQSFPDWRANPLFTYSLPHLIEGNIARNLGMGIGLSGWISLLPLAIVLAGLLAVWRLLPPPEREASGE